jgi:hypothetical protein
MVHEVRPGDEIVVVRRRLGATARPGEILAVPGTSDHPPDRERGDDGPESVVFPAATPRSADPARRDER